MSSKMRPELTGHRPVDGLHPQREDEEFKERAAGRDIRRYADYLRGQVRELLTPEQYQPVAPMQRDGRPALWEACQTLNGSWGYDRDNLEFKTADQLIRMLVDGVSKDGNLLLNVGPIGRGCFDPNAARILREIGQWMALHERSIRGCGASELTPPPDCRYTQHADSL